MLKLFTFLFQFFNFPLAGKPLFTRQIEVQSRKKFFIYDMSKEKVPTLEGIKNLYLH